MTNRWKKIIAERACEVITAKNLSAASSALLTDEITPEALIQSLVKAGKWMDATKVLAYALPRREAVWWACMCARGMKGVTDDETEQAALEAAEKWVYQPTDEHRAAAFIAMQKCKGSSGGLMCALAAAFSEEVLPLGGGQNLEVDISAFPDLVFAAIFNAAKEGGGDLLDERLQDYLVIGEDIARGGSGKRETPAE